MGGAELLELLELAEDAHVHPVRVCGEQLLAAVGDLHLSAAGPIHGPGLGQIGDGPADPVGEEGLVAAG